MSWIVILALGWAHTVRRLADSSSRLVSVVDAFLLAAVTGWAVLSAIPKAISITGWWAIAGLVVGALGARQMYTRRYRHAQAILAMATLVGVACEMVGDDVTGRLAWSTAVSPTTVLPVLAVLMTLGAPTLITLFVEEGRSLPRQAGDRWLVTAASLLGLAATSLPSVLSPWPTVVPGALDALATLRTLVLEASPGLLLALVLSGLLRAFPMGIPYAWLGRGNALGQALRGVAVGLHLPICSCGVVPLYRSLIVGGAPPAAALAFLVATPEIGLDAILLSVPLLGPWLSIARVVAAALTALLVGMLVGRWVKRAGPIHASTPASSKHSMASWPTRLRTVGVAGFREATDHTVPLIVAGLIVAALVEPLVDPNILTRLPPGLDVPIAGILGIPIYVCASAATPLVAVLMHKGLSAGAAIAFLLTGPATNLTTFGVLGRLHGPRVAVGFGITVGLSATLLGWAANVAGVGGGIALHSMAEESPGVTHWICGLALGMAVLATLHRQGIRGIWEGLIGGDHHDHEHDQHHHHHEGCCGRHDHSAGECNCESRRYGPHTPAAERAPRSVGQHDFTRVPDRHLLMRTPAHKKAEASDREPNPT